MKIQVLTITGRKEEIFADSISELKIEIEKNMGIPVNEQKLLSYGKIISDENLCNTVHLLINLNGGAKGKNKKQTIKKVKKKNVHKKEKLSSGGILKGSGIKIQRFNNVTIGNISEGANLSSQADNAVVIGSAYESFGKDGNAKISIQSFNNLKIGNISGNLHATGRNCAVVIGIGCSQYNLKGSDNNAQGFNNKTIDNTAEGAGISSKSEDKIDCKKF